VPTGNVGDSPVPTGDVGDSTVPTGDVGDSTVPTGSVGDSTVPTGGVGCTDGVGCPLGCTGGTAEDRDPEWTEMSSKGMLVSGGDSSPGVTEADMVMSSGPQVRVRFEREKMR